MLPALDSIPKWNVAVPTGLFFFFFTACYSKHKGPCPAGKHRMSSRSHNRRTTPHPPSDRGACRTEREPQVYVNNMNPPPPRSTASPNNEVQPFY